MGGRFGRPVVGINAKQMPGQKRDCASESEQKEHHDRSSEGVTDTVRMERQSPSTGARE